ncbi:origin recognition complex subunit 3-like protein [Corchorus olitorius]|uniref:Origin recognition complex subunit 3-like protein n=1 Tax=Corchorus olitorius TaxID=93759 RepID=A0A1R3G3P5_9ROSI|nr:origin recognition complex subunit 3-like protein [Corchorus olitorius]
MDVGHILVGRPWLYDHDMDHKTKPNTYSFIKDGKRARFCRGVMELQITGVIRMPTKRRPDFAQRVAFGLELSF